MGEDEISPSEETNEEISEVKDTTELPQPLTERPDELGRTSELSPDPVDNEVLKTEDKTAEIETIVQDANVIIDEYFKTTSARVRDIDSAMKGVGKSEDALKGVLDKIKSSLSELEERRMRGERCDDIIEDLSYVRSGLEQAQDTMNHDHVVRNAKGFSEDFFDDESSWMNKGGAEVFLADLRQAVQLKEPTTKEAALARLKAQIEQLGGKPSFDAKNQAVATDLFVREVGEQLLKSVSLGFDIESSMRVRLPEDAYQMKRKINDALQETQDLEGHLRVVLKDIPSDYYFIARAGERLLYEMEGVLMEAQQINSENNENGDVEDDNSEVTS